ncbi:hypothetical protein N7523_010038 [Penicillium sp. IBT 18751x]|nr:hypothetical protein N7523_010038 [Penicillium sp. IBT 18751x]
MLIFPSSILSEEELVAPFGLHWKRPLRSKGRTWARTTFEETITSEGKRRRREISSSRLPSSSLSWLYQCRRSELVGRKFSENPFDHTPCNIIQSQRIPPFPESIRRFLIDKYCPAGRAGQILTNKADKDSFIRPYLGRRRTQSLCSQSRFKAFSLPHGGWWNALHSI